MLNIDKIKKILKSRDKPTLSIMREVYSKYRIPPSRYLFEKRDTKFFIWSYNGSFETLDFLYCKFRSGYFKIPKNEKIQ